MYPKKECEICHREFGTNVIDKHKKKCSRETRVIPEPKKETKSEPMIIIYAPNLKSLS